MNDGQKTLIRLLRMAVGCDDVEPMTLTERVWAQVYKEARCQSLTGVIYGVVNRMGHGVDIPRDLMLGWTYQAEAIRGFNAKMNAEAARLTGWLGERGRRTAILKGQANARLYPHPDERQPGDIDIWVEGGRESVLKLLTDEGMMDNKDDVSYHHVHLKKNDCGISVEVHFRPASGNYNPVTNSRLQRFLEDEIRQSKECPEGFNVPTLRFALIMQMAHIQRHFLSGGVGLRHIMDYYMLMKNAKAEDRQFVGNQLRSFGLRNTAGAVMWLMEKLFSLTREEMLCPPDKRRGKWMLDEVMDGGNFGRHFDKKNHGYWRTIYDGQMRTISLCRFNFWESFFTEANFWLFVIKTIPKRIRYRTFSLSKIKEE